MSVDLGVPARLEKVRSQAGCCAASQNKRNCSPARTGGRNKLQPIGTRVRGLLFGVTKEF
jgi:hypothetical protein